MSGFWKGTGTDEKGAGDGAGYCRHPSTEAWLGGLTVGMKEENWAKAQIECKIT